MNRLFTAAMLLLCAISCTDTALEQAPKKEVLPEEEEGRLIEALPSSNKGGNALGSNPDPFGYVCDPQHPAFDQQCCDDRIFGITFSWESTTHPFTTAAGYKYAYDGPSGKSNYRIKATAGEALTYDMRLTAPGMSGTTRVRHRMSLVPKDGQYAELTTTYGTLVYDPASGGENAGIIELEWDFSEEPPITYTIPANPYPTREMKVKIAADYFNYWVPGSCGYGGNLIDLGNGFGITDFNDRGWVEITLPRTTPPVTEFVNAGAAVYMAAGAPLGTGTVMPIPYPTTVTVGNLLLMVSTTRVSSSVPVGPPAGWSTFASYPYGVYIYSKIATGGESGNVNLTWSGSTTNNRNGRIYQFKDASPTAYSVNTDNSTSTAKCGSMTSTNAIDLAVSFIYSSASAAVNTYTGGALTWSEPVGDSRGLGLNVAPFTTGGQASGIATQPVQGNKTLNFVLKY